MDAYYCAHCPLVFELGILYPNPNVDHEGCNYLCTACGTMHRARVPVFWDRDNLWGEEVFVEVYAFGPLRALDVKNEWYVQLDNAWYRVNNPKVALLPDAPRKQITHRRVPNEPECWRLLQTLPYFDPHLSVLDDDFLPKIGALVLPCGHCGAEGAYTYYRSFDDRAAGQPCPLCATPLKWEYCYV